MEPKQLEAMLSDAETRLRRLKTLYDQWLSGFERLEPTIPRKELDDLFVRMKREQIRNTALRFRLQQAHQRYMTLTTYWRRLARQIEEGTYQRDVLKARKIRAQHELAEREVKSAADDHEEFEDQVEPQVERAAQTAAAERSTEASRISAKPAVPTTPTPTLKAPETAAVAAAPAVLSTSSVGPTPGAKGPPPIPPRAMVSPRSISPFALPLPGSAGSRPAAPPPRETPPLPTHAAAGNGPPSAPAAQTPPLPRPPAPRATDLQTARAASMPQAPPPRSAEQNSGGLSNDDMQRIYARYVAARKDNAERVDNVRLENIEKTLRGMLPQLEKKHVGKKIDFEVVVKDGKVALKPVAK